MTISGDKINIERRDTVYTLITNHINEEPRAKEETKKELQEKFMKYGRKEKLILSYHIEPIWSDEKMKLERKHNDSIKTLIDISRNKYGINSMIIHSVVKPGYDYPYDPKTKDDSLRLSQFKNEEEELNKHLYQLPDKKTQQYYLFNTDHSCNGSHYDFEFLDIYPKAASDELYKICDFISALKDIKH